MKTFWGVMQWIGISVLLVIWLGPWAVLLADGVWMFLTGHVLTSIPWDQPMVLIALCWPVFVGFLVCGIGG